MFLFFSQPSKMKKKHVSIVATIPFKGFVLKKSENVSHERFDESINR